MQIMISVEDNYQGITLEERMALCHVFDRTEDDVYAMLQFSDEVLPGGATK